MEEDLFIKIFFVEDIWIKGKYKHIPRFIQTQTNIQTIIPGYNNSNYNTVYQFIKTSIIIFTITESSSLQLTVVTLL